MRVIRRRFSAFHGLVKCAASLHLFGDDNIVTFVEDVRHTLQEQHTEDVFLVLRRIHLAAQNIRGFHEVAFELSEG